MELLNFDGASGGEEEMEERECREEEGMRNEEMQNEGEDEGQGMRIGRGVEAEKEQMKFIESRRSENIA